MTARVELSGVTIRAPGGRPLFDGLTMRLSREHVALVGRNGVGKSTLLAVLAGTAEANAGRVWTSSPPHFVPQMPDTGTASGVALSHGQRRRLALTEARDSGAEVLLLDEPTEDLDDAAVAWLRDWLRDWPGCLVVASHDRRLLGDFQHFLVASESGCRVLSGSLAELEVDLEREHERAQVRHVRELHRLAAYEEHTAHVARRKARKKRYGRCSELDRGTPRVRLNQKRSDAQVSHGRLEKLRKARLDALRQWSLSTRRALGVSLALDLPVPRLPAEAREVLRLSGVSAHGAGRPLLAPLDLWLARQRFGVVGPNGAGKTTLLGIMLGRREPTAGRVVGDVLRIGAIEQGAADWLLEDSLLSVLALQGTSADEAAKLLVAHRFPLALADRPLRTLSPGERARAALIALFQRSPPVELLILDEPTFSLDLVGQRALTEALRAWPGGLVVASHDRPFLAAIGVEELIELGPSAPREASRRFVPSRGSAQASPPEAIVRLSQALVVEASRVHGDDIAAGEDPDHAIGLVARDDRKTSDVLARHLIGGVAERGVVVDDDGRPPDDAADRRRGDTVVEQIASRDHSDEAIVVIGDGKALVS